MGFRVFLKMKMRTMTIQFPPSPSLPPSLFPPLKEKRRKKRQVCQGVGDDEGWDASEKELASVTAN